VSGLALLGVAMVQDSTVLLLGGGGALFASVLLFGPVLIPRLVRIGGAVPRTAARPAAAHAVRDPRRTAPAAASLLVGVTLTTAVLTGMDTWRTALDEQIGRDHPIDFALASPGEPVSADLLGRIRRTPGVEQAVSVEGVVVRVTGLGEPIPVVAAPDAGRVARDGGAFAGVEPGTIRIDSEAFRLRAGDEVTVSGGERGTVGA